LVEKGYLFHGSGQEFEAFDPSMIQGGTSANEGYGAYFTNSEYKASEYGSHFLILDTNGLNIVQSRDTFSQIGFSLFGNPKSLEQDRQKYTPERYMYFKKMFAQKIYDFLWDVLLNVSYENTEKIKNFIINKGDCSIYDLLSYAATNLNYGDKDVSTMCRDMGIDGYIIGNVYVIINFDKLNQNLVKDKSALIASVM
jgi:hypothetical protein